MHFMRASLWICVFWIPVGRGEDIPSGKPDLDFFMKAACPIYKPYKCPPDAKCYNNEQYCTSNGDLKSCFPHENVSDDTTILDWCQKLVSGSNLSDPTCQCACFSKFHKKLFISDQVTLPTVTNSTIKDSTSCDCREYAFCVILAICLAGSVILNIVLFLQQRRTQRRKTPTVEDASTQVDANHLAGNNRRESVQDKTEESAVPPLEGVLDGDKCLNVPTLDAAIAPAIFPVDPVQGRSANTQNCDPVNQFVSAQGTRNTQRGQVRYSAQHTASFESTFSRPDNIGTPEELAELIPTESDKITTRDRLQQITLSIPEAAGSHPDDTNKRNLD